MTKRKLVIFMPSIEGGGVEKNMFIISNFLAKKIKGSSIITANKDYNKKFKNLKIINSKFIRNYKVSRKWKYIFCLIELIKLIIKDRNVTIFSFQANFYCTIVCKIFFNVKIITRSNTSPAGWSKNIIKNIIFSYLFQKIDQVIVNSLQFKKEIHEKFNINSFCIYNPLNLNAIKELSREKDNFSFFNNYKELKIINVGRYVDQKDQITLLKALNKIKYKVQFKALIIGRGILKEELISFIKKNNLTRKIKLLTFKSNPYKYIKLCDLFILSSKYEGLPNVLLEAISLGKFIISTNCSTGPSEILSNGRGGYLFKVGDFGSLANKILYFNKNKVKLKKKIKYAQAQLYRFNYKKNLKKYLKIVKMHL
jgi:glycosyltransferase involved in cell wall biosynthesis